MQKEIKTIRITSVAHSHQLLEIGKPKHPLFSIVRFEDIAQISNKRAVKADY